MGGVHGRIRTDERDRVTLEVRLPGRLFRLILGISATVSHTVLLGVPLFGIAGTLDWPRAWVFIAVWDLNVLLVCVLSSTEVLLERMWPLRDGRRLERGDLVFVLLLFPLALTYLVVLPLEVFHLDLPDPPPLGVAVVGLVSLTVGWALMTLSVRQNRFASTVVKIQTERHHEVIDSGVYGIVRHPMYLGASLLTLGVPVWLGSYLALTLGVLGVVGLAQRIRIEERVLRAGLPGYTDYQERVRYRLVPFVW